jgi:hypothetical protein
MPRKTWPAFQYPARAVFEMVAEQAAVRQSILLLLTTVPGERVMRPDYGCDLQKLVFSPNDATTHGLAIHYVRRAWNAGSLALISCGLTQRPMEKIPNAWISCWNIECAKLSKAKI